MHKISQLIPTDINKIKYQLIPTDRYENDQLYDQLKELLNPGFKKWYMKIFYKLGREKVLELASVAYAEGKNPKKYFNFLLKRQSKTTQTKSARHAQGL